MDMYTPSSFYFNPTNVDGYVSHRANEAIRATLGGNPQKIDVPQFLEDWVHLCTLYFEWLGGQRIGETDISSSRQLANRAIGKRCTEELAAISREITGIWKIVGAYEEELGKLPDVRAASEGQIALLEVLQSRYEGLQLI